MRRCKVSERLAAYPYLCYSLARSAGGLSTFSILVPLSTSARLCTCLFMLRSKQSRAYWLASSLMGCCTLHYMCRSRCSCSRSRAHCSRSSSTGTGSCCSRCYRDGSHAPAVSAAALSFQRTQPHQRRLLRFACAIWSLAWISCVLWQRCHCHNTHKSMPSVKRHTGIGVPAGGEVEFFEQ